MNQDDDTNLEESEAEKVGYAKPPRQNRFKKRQSGHRQGRPRGRPNVAKAASKIFSMRVPVKLGEQVVNLPALEALIRVHGAKAMHGDRKSQRAMSVIMEKLGFFDEKGDSENKGVMILRNSERLTEDEWVWLYGDSPRGFCQAYPEYATLARNA